MEENQNPEFVGNEEKFKYLAIHGYEDFQRDKEGKLADGSRLWIKQATRLDSDPDYQRLTLLQREVLSALRRLTGLHANWPRNNPTVVSRGMCALPTDRPHVTHAIRTLVSRNLVTLSNERLRFLEVVDKRKKKEVVEPTSQPSPDETEKTTEVTAPPRSARPADCTCKGRKTPGHYPGCPHSGKSNGQASPPTRRIDPLRDWDESIDGIPADTIRRAIRYTLDIKKDWWLRENMNVAYVRRNARKLVEETPPKHLEPKYESKPDQTCSKCKGTGDVIVEDGLYQSSVTCECVQQVEVR
ncbi:MAG TPA: hypothetical protein VFA89_21010 [Terriglobales bacterium]|nr:hypothetical protein [Terriglobales bacterium]